MNLELTNALKQIKVGTQVEIWEAVKILVKILAKRQDSDTVRELLDLMEMSSAETERRIAAASILGSLKSIASLDPLIRILENRTEPDALRDQAAESLGYLSDQKSRAPLLANIFDESIDVAFSCVFALRSVGKLEDIPELDKLTKNVTLTNSYGASLAQEAQEAIDQIRNRAI